jgi:hypothetical protein
MRAILTGWRKAVTPGLRVNPVAVHWRSRQPAPTAAILDPFIFVQISRGSGGWPSVLQVPHDHPAYG